MQRILNIRMLSVRAALLAVLVGGLLVPGAVAQSAKQNQKSDKQTSGSSQTQAPSAGSKAAEEESAPANKEHDGGPHEGIKVHGHWVIDVRDPDGKLVTHREFENAFLGGSLLQSILVRSKSMGYWVVVLDVGSRGYSLTEPSNTTYDADSYNLAVSADLHDAGFSLSGSFTPATSDAISGVETAGGFCPPTNPPQTPCQGSNFVAFTGTTISPVNVAGGQIVQVTVTITFS